MTYPAPKTSPAAEPGPAAAAPLLVKRYASRRLYNTESSDYVTLDDVAAVIRAGREVRIVDLKSGDDLTRQYLLQIIAEHESRGENVLPIDVLTDLVRSYATNARSVVPQFLAASFEMLREGQSKVLENLGAFPNPMSAMPGFAALRRQQQLFLQAMSGAWPGTSAPAAEDGPPAPGKPDPGPQAPPHTAETPEMAEIRRQLADLQSRVSKL